MQKILAILIIFLISAAWAQDTNELRQYKEWSKSERYRKFQDHYKAIHQNLMADELHEDLKELIISGNQIRVLVTNQGSISTPSADNANADLVWPAGPNGLGYAFEFGPLVAAEVLDDNGDTLHIVSDGFFGGSGGEFEPGTSNRWGWEPRVGFSDPSSNELAHASDLDTNFDGKPDSWPQNWFNDVLGRYVWPAFLGDDATTPDEEVYYVMDDFSNAEFPYYPFPADSAKQGLGLELQVRIFQFNNPLAEDIIFLVYTVTNISEKRLDKVYLGMFGDPHVGGPNDFADDFAGFISPFDSDFDDRPNVRNMLYAYDEDGIGDFGLPTGYFGYRFLESPGIDSDGFDNDNDGLTDESQFNDAGLFEFDPITNSFHWSGDEDGDWLAEFDDVGVDGFKGTGDPGEGDGKPTQLFYTDVNNNGILDPGEPTAESRLTGMRFFGGEPNFGFLDIAESDQLGLTSFNAILFGGNNEPRNDELMWDNMSTPNQRPDDPAPEIEQEADNVFIYGSGSFGLEPGESQRFSIALLLGEDFEDLLSNAEISQQIFESDYRFAQAPNKPALVAVPGDKKVTLYWDTGAEDSFDPFVSRANVDDPDKGFDFEGYRVYRSQDFSFNDTKTITDSKGVPFLSEPLSQRNGLPAQWDLINEYSGLAEIEYQNRGVRYDLGRNTGLVHTFVDSNNVKDGVTYFYAVTSYDRGDEKAILPPSESQRTIQRNAVTREFSFDVNTAMVVPGPPAAGFNPPGLAGMDDAIAEQVAGFATGQVRIEFLDPLLVQSGKKFDIEFSKVEVDSADSVLAYTVLDNTPVDGVFASRDTFFVSFNSCCPVVEGSVSVSELNGAAVDPATYEIDYENGRIRGTSSNALPAGESFAITYKVFPVKESTSLDGEDFNPVFDGMKLLIEADEDGLDSLSTAGGRSGFKTVETGTNFSDEYTTIGLAGLGNPRAFPGDFEIHFVDYDTTAEGDLINPADSSDLALGGIRTPFWIKYVQTGDTVDFFIDESPQTRGNRRWDWQDDIVLIKPDAAQFTETTYGISFSPPFSLVETEPDVFETIIDDPVYPGEGDVFLLFSTKSFQEGDAYTFTTEAATYSDAEAEAALDDIIVVPNPYIAFSSAELAGIRPGQRDDRLIQFRNLPRTCTIRIYTIVGDFVDKIEKDDDRDFAAWDVLSFESQNLAYGVYIYHVDAPGIGTKIGRLAIIK